jgi:hypothetical protein
LPLADLRFTQDTVIEVAAGSTKKDHWIPQMIGRRGGREY